MYEAFSIQRPLLAVREAHQLRAREVVHHLLLGVSSSQQNQVSVRWRLSQKDASEGRGLFVL